MESLRRFARHSLALVPIGLGLLTVLAGCGTSPTTSTTTPKPTSYHYEAAGAITSFDPVLAYDVASSAVLENVYQTLYGYTKAGGTTPQPELATGYTVSTDGLSYTFDLRHNVVFHSGNPFTCADVEYSIERALVTNPPSSGVWSLALPLTGTSQNANANPSVTWSLIDGSITCPSPYQAVFHLAQKSVAFLAILGQSTYGIVDSAWAKSHGEWDGTQATWKSWIGADLTKGYLNDHTSGTGAYQLTSASSTSVTATAFKDYWGTAPSTTVS